MDLCFHSMRSGGEVVWTPMRVGVVGRGLDGEEWTSLRLMPWDPLIYINHSMKMEVLLCFFLEDRWILLLLFKNFLRIAERETNLLGACRQNSRSSLYHPRPVEHTVTGTRCQIILAYRRKKGAGKYVKKMTSNFGLYFTFRFLTPSSSRGERC